MQLCQIWKCSCGAKRVWGFSLVPDLAYPIPLLLCERGCSKRHVPHTFVGMEQMEYMGNGKWVRPMRVTDRGVN